jgi:hypothetical protein
MIEKTLLLHNSRSKVRPPIVYPPQVGLLKDQWSAPQSAAGAFLSHSSFSAFRIPISPFKSLSPYKLFDICVSNCDLFKRNGREIGLFGRNIGRIGGFYR